jgi:hypothetical protein
MLICIDKDWLLLQGNLAGEYLGNVPKRDLILLSTLYCEGSLNEVELYKTLKAGRED